MSETPFVENSETEPNIEPVEAPPEEPIIPTEAPVEEKETIKKKHLEDAAGPCLVPITLGSANEKSGYVKGHCDQNRASHDLTFHSFQNETYGVLVTQRIKTCWAFIEIGDSQVSCSRFFNHEGAHRVSIDGRVMSWNARL